MRREYEYGFIDGSIFLVRNFKAMKPLLKNDWCGSDQLTKSFILSILKLAREQVKCERYFILWDKKPYWKTEILKSEVGKSEYKEDRQKETEKLVKKLSEAKYSLMCNLDNLGLTQAVFKGWEADDLAYLASQQVKGRSKKSVLISYDSDWISWVDENTDYFNILHNSVYTYEYILKNHPPVKGLSLFESKAWRDSLNGSHNNLKRTRVQGEKLTTLEYYNDFHRGDYSHFDDIELFKAQLHTFDFTQYPEYNKVSHWIDHVFDHGHIATEEEFRKIRAKMNIKPKGLRSDWYMQFTESLNPDKWK